MVPRARCAPRFLTNEMMAGARARVNKKAGSRRMLSHAIFTPGCPGWRAALATDRLAALKREYDEAGAERSNLRYGYVARARA